MAELRALLDQEARRISAPPEALEATLQWGHRRRRRVRTLTIALALSLALGGLAGAFAAFRGARNAQPTDGKSWAGIWPQGSFSEAEAAQARADVGDPAYTWELDGKTVLRRFALDELEWRGFTILEIHASSSSSEPPPDYNNESDLSDPDASGPFRFIIAGCDALGPGVTCPRHHSAPASARPQRHLERDEG